MTYNPEDNQILVQTFIDIIKINENLSGELLCNSTCVFSYKKSMHPYIFYIHE